MALIRIDKFGGLIPKLDEKRLPENCAVEAINVDLQGHGIEPVYATLAKHIANTDNTKSRGPFVIQQPTVCFGIYDYGFANETRFPAALANRVIGAGDYLYYAVYLPAGQAVVAGFGGCDLHFTDGTKLGNVLDQNGVGSLNGDLTNYAVGKWYLRKIPLATKAGKTADRFEFWSAATAQPLIAYLGWAYINSSNNFAFVDPTTVFWDADMQTDGTSNNVFSGTTTIDEDDAAFATGGYWMPEGAQKNRGAMAVPATLPGRPRNKLLLFFSERLAANANLVHGFSNHDVFRSYHLQQMDMNPSFADNWSRWGAQSLGAGSPIGWCAVMTPKIAPSLAVVGGAPPTVTRSYVFTRVSEDGFESGPSLPVTATGNRDGTWQLTGISELEAGAHGTDRFSSAHSALKQRVYRTPEGSSVYRFVAEIALAVTTLNDLALDAALGEELPTLNYLDMPPMRAGAGWINGMVGGIAEGTETIFCEPFQYHAWPAAYRYTLPWEGVSCGVIGDRFATLTKGKPVIFTGSSPGNLSWAEVPQGEACITPKSVISADMGVIYPGKTGWQLLDYGGVQNVTKEFFSTADYAATVGFDTIALFDNRKLYWLTQGQAQGYSFEFGAGDRSLTKFEAHDKTYTITGVYGMGYYAPRDNRWISYATAGGTRVGKLFGDTSQRLKWTWKSKPIRYPQPVALKVAQIDSNEWDTLSASMKAREAAYKTGGGGAPYTIDITGLTQAEAWCYLKVWCEADKGADKILVYDNFVVSDRPVYLARAMKSDCWQFEIRGNMAISSIALASSERELNAE